MGDSHDKHDPAALERAGDELVAWLVDDANGLEVAAMVDALGWRLCGAGLQIDRLTMSLRLLNAKHLAASIVWRPNQPLEFRTFDWAERDQGLYDRSPFRVAHQNRTWLALDIDATPDQAFGIVPDLKRQGIKHYLVVPVPFPDGTQNTITLATKSPDPFSEPQKALVRRMIAPLALVMELKMMHRALRDVVATYVGRGPAEQILRGTVHRGQLTQIKAAIYLADLRGFTAISTQMPPQATADVLNRYYDIVVPPIEAQGGEVLKFIGDAVLAIFPEPTFGMQEACCRALNAARDALRREVEPLRVDGHDQPVRFGIAVHQGDVVYGNVGSGERLDFTVVGRDVNVAARICALCSLLGRPFLVSSEVAETADAFGLGYRSHGAHMVRGLPDPLPVFEPLIEEPDLEAMEHKDDVSVGPMMI